ncbi:unnamed protein product [Closterium sp. NIES-65]|nr:unnamed protein product [Closterium sp. NIES-65]
MDKPPAFRDNSLHHRSKRPRQQDSHESNSTSGRRYVVAVHVGAGYHSKRYEQRYLRAMRDALAAAELVLRGAGGTSAEGQRGECAGAGEAGRLDAKNRASAPGSGLDRCCSSTCTALDAVVAAVRCLERVRMLAGEGALLWAQTHAPYAVARHPQDLVTPAAEGQWRKYRRIVGALEQHQGRKECVRAFRAVEKEEDLDEVRTEQGSMGTWGEDAKRERRDYGGWGKSTREGDEEDVEGIEGMGGEVDWTGGREEEGKTRVVGKGEEEGEEEGEEGEKEGEGEDEEEEEQEGPWDTVGAVCFEVASGAAAAASSGGIAFKAPGRVGCAAMHGAACWADASISTASNLPKSSAADPACSEAAQEISVRGDFHAAAVETESEHDQKQQQHQPQMLAVAASVSGAGEPIVECQLARCVCEAAMEGGESDPAAMGIARFNAHVAALSAAALDDQQQRGETERKRQWPVASDVGLLLLSAYPQHKSPSGALLDPSSSAYSAGRSFPKSSSLLDDPAKFEAYEQLNLHQARSSRHPSVKAGRSSSSASSRGKLSVRWALEEGEEGHEGVGRRKSSVARVEEVDGEEMGEGDGLIGGEGGEGREEEGGVEGDGEGGGGRRRNGKLFRMLSADFCVGGENGGRSGAYGGRGMDEGSRNWGRGGRSIGGRGGWGGSMGWWRGWGRDAAEGGDVSDWGEGGSGGSGGRGGGGGGGGEGGGVGSNMKGIVGEGVALLDDEEVERMDDEVIQALFERVVEAQTQLHNYKNLVAFSLFTALYLLMLCLQDYSGDSSYSFASSSDFYTWLNNSIIQVKLDNVLLVDKLTLNLISQSQLDSGGCKTFSDKGSIWVFGSDWKVIAEGSRKQGLYEMKLHEKQSGEKPTYMAEPEGGKVARDELRTKLKKVPIKELQQQALPMAAAVSTVDVNLLHRRMGHAGHTRIKQLVKKNMAAGVKGLAADVTPHEAFYKRKPNLEFLRVWGCMTQYGEAAGPDHKLLPRTKWGIHLGICPESKGWVIRDVETGKVTATRDVTFYEQDTYLEWKGRKQGAVAKKAAAAPTPVEEMIDGSEKEGIGAANGSGDNDDYEDHTTPGFDWVWEVQELSSPSTAVEEGEEENDKEEEAGDSATNEAGEEEAEISDVEESVAESASTGYSDPWRIIDTGDNEKAAAEIEDLLVDGAIIIGREIEGDSVQQGTDDNAAAEKGGAENENEKMGKGKRVKKPNLNSLADKEVDVGAEIEAWGNRERALKAYQSMVGSVMYPVSCTRVDVAYAASFLGQRVLQPEGRKWKEIERTITYLLQGDDEGLLFEGGEESLELVGYADASHGSDKKDGRGAYGYSECVGKRERACGGGKVVTVALRCHFALREAMSECVGKRERACGGGKVVTVALRCHFALREAMCGDGVVTVALRCHFALREAIQSSSWNLCSTAIRDVCWFQDPQLFTEFTGWYTVTVRLPDNDWYVAGEWERVRAKIHTLSPPSHPFRFQDPQLFIELKGWHTVTVRLPDNDWFVSLTAPTGGVGVYVYESLGKKTTGASEPGTDSSSGVYSSGSAAEGSVMISAPPPLPPPPPPVFTTPAPAPFRLPSSRVSPSASPPPASPTASTFESTQKSTPPPASPTASPFESTQKSTPPPASPTASPFESTQKSTPPPASPTASPSTKEYLRPSNGTGANVLLASVDGCVEDGESGLQRCRQVRCGGEVLDAVHVQAGVCSGADRPVPYGLSVSRNWVHTFNCSPVPTVPPAPHLLALPIPSSGVPLLSLPIQRLQLVCTLRQVLPMLSFSPADSSSPLHRPPHSSQPPKLPPCTSPTLPSPHPHPFSPPPPPATSSQPIAEAQRLVWESLGTTDGERIRVCQVAVARALPSRRFSAAQQALFVRILVMALQSVVQKMPSGAVQAATHLLHIFNDAVVSPDASPCPQGASLFLLLSSAPMVFPGRKRFEEPCASQVGAFVITQELPPLPTILLSSLPGSPSSPPADFMVLWDSASFTRRAISDGQRVTWVWNDDDYHELSGVASKGREERETGEVWNGDDYHELSGSPDDSSPPQFAYTKVFGTARDIAVKDSPQSLAFTLIRARNDSGTARNMKPRDSLPPYVLLLASLCAPACRLAMLANGRCDQQPRDSLPPYALLLASLCAPDCRLSMLANGRCDQPCNVALCDFDGGDCACGGAGSGSIGSSVSSGSDAAGAGGGSGRGGSGSGSSGGGASAGGSVGGGVGVQWCTCPVLQIRGDDGACCEAAGAGTGIKVPFSLQRFGPTVHPLLSTLGSTATALPRVVSQYNSPSPRLSVLMGFTIVQYLWHSSRSDLKPTKEAECDVMLAVSQPEP